MAQGGQGGPILPPSGVASRDVPPWLSQAWNCGTVLLVHIMVTAKGCCPDVCRCGDKGCETSSSTKEIINVDEHRAEEGLQPPLKPPKATGPTVEFRLVKEDNLQQLKSINQAIFPIRYQDKFYRDCMAFEDVTQLAYYRGRAVGGIACRLERAENGGARLYIMTLGVLAPYRDLGIGSMLLQRALEAVVFDPNITEACLHVQTSNEGALRFYSRYGFEIVDTIKNYYRRLDPPDCHLIRLKLGCSSGSMDN